MGGEENTLLTDADEMDIRCEASFVASLVKKIWKVYIETTTSTLYRTEKKSNWAQYSERSPCRRARWLHTDRTNLLNWLRLLCWIYLNALVKKGTAFLLIWFAGTASSTDMLQLESSGHALRNQLLFQRGSFILATICIYIELLLTWLSGRTTSHVTDHFVVVEEGETTSNLL